MSALISILLSGVWAARLFSLPLLLEVNAPLADERRQFGGLAMPRLRALVRGGGLAGRDLVMPVTGVLGEIIARAGVPRNRIVVTSNGVDTARFPACRLWTARACRKPSKAGWCWASLAMSVPGMACRRWWICWLQTRPWRTRAC